MNRFKNSIQLTLAFILQHIFLLISMHIGAKLFYEQGFTFSNFSSLGKIFFASIFLYNAIPILNLISLILFNRYIKNSNSQPLLGIVRSIGYAFLFGTIIWGCLEIYYMVVGENYLGINELLQYERKLLNPFGYFMISFLVSNMLFFPFYSFIIMKYSKKRD